MSALTLLTTPLVVNNVTISDGDYIQLQLPMPALSTFTTTGVPANNAAIFTSPISVVGTPYSMSANIDDMQFTFKTWSHSNAQTSYSQTGQQTMSTPITRTGGNDGSLSMKNDVVMTPPNGYRYTTRNLYASGSVFRGNVLSETFDNSNGFQVFENTSTAVNRDDRLVVEYHPNNYIAFRTPTGLYLHMKNVYAYTPSPLNNITPNTDNALTLTYSSEPSELPSAQWQVYSGSATTIMLFNRGARAFVQLATSKLNAQTEVATAQYYGASQASKTVVSQQAATYYNNDWTQYVQYNTFVGQPYWRLYGTATSTNASKFTINRISVNTCDITTSPMNTSCNPSVANVFNAQSNFCNGGDKAFTSACKTFLANQQGNVSEEVLTSCARYPNEQSLCACVNYGPAYHEVVELLRINNTSFLPQCNATACATGVGVTAWIAKIVQCVSKICIQGLSLSGSNVNIGNVDFNCSLGSGAEASDTTTPANDTSWEGMFTAIFANITQFGIAVQEYAQKAIGALTILSILTCILLLAVVYFAFALFTGALAPTLPASVFLFAMHLLLFVR